MADEYGGLFAEGPLGDEGRAVLREMEAARQGGDFVRLRRALERCLSLPNVNRSMVENALKEMDAATAQGQEGAPTSPHDQAMKCKDAGNLKLKQGTKAALKEANELYSQGIGILLQVAEEKRSAQENTLLSQLHSNRAHALLQTREFAASVDECKRCLKLDPKNVKAYYRAARGSLLNGLYQQSIDFCLQGLVVDPQSQDIQKLKESAEARLTGQKKMKEKLNVSPQELMDQQTETQRLGRQVQILRAQIQQKKNRKKGQELTKQYVDSVKKGESAYVACGRCFLQLDKASINRDITQTVASIDAELPKMEKALEEVSERYEKARADFESICKHLKR